MQIRPSDINNFSSNEQKQQYQLSQKIIGEANGIADQFIRLDGSDHDMDEAHSGMVRLDGLVATRNTPGHGHFLWRVHSTQEHTFLNGHCQFDPQSHEISELAANVSEDLCEGDIQDDYHERHAVIRKSEEGTTFQTQDGRVVVGRDGTLAVFPEDKLAWAMTADEDEREVYPTNGFAI